jgi:hypothetical protein
MVQILHVIHYTCFDLKLKANDNYNYNLSTCFILKTNSGVILRNRYIVTKLLFVKYIKCTKRFLIHTPNKQVYYYIVEQTIMISITLIITPIPHIIII